MAAGGYLAVRELDDGHGLGVVKFSPDCVRLKWFCGKILMDEWCYESELVALHAMADWDGEGEPPGWTRHPRTGRHRPDGDPAQEFTLK